MRNRLIVGGGTSEKPCQSQQEAYCFIIDDRHEECWESETECDSQRELYVAQNTNQFGACRLRVTSTDLAGPSLAEY